jgi:hypothetical protein
MLERPARDQHFSLSCKLRTIKFYNVGHRKFAEDSEQEIDRASNSTDEGISVGSSSASAEGKADRPQARLIVGSGSDDSSSESAWSEMYAPGDSAKQNCLRHCGGCGKLECSAFQYFRIRPESILTEGEGPVQLTSLY